MGEGSRGTIASRVECSLDGNHHCSLTEIPVIYELE